MSSDKDKSTFSSILDGIEHRWKIVLGFLVTLAASLAFYLRSKDMKRVLKNANDSHEKENDVNDDARKKLTTGLDNLRDDTANQIKDANKEADRKEKDLRSEKKKFIEEAEDSSTLAADIASKIGADFVEND